jgi:hypothetical protein
MYATTLLRVFVGQGEALGARGYVGHRCSGWAPFRWKMANEIRFDSGLASTAEDIIVVVCHFVDDLIYQAYVCLFALGARIYESKQKRSDNLTYSRQPS